LHGEGPELQSRRACRGETPGALQTHWHASFAQPAPDLPRAVVGNGPLLAEPRPSVMSAIGMSAQPSPKPARSTAASGWPPARKHARRRRRGSGAGLGHYGRRL